MVWSWLMHLKCIKYQINAVKSECSCSYKDDWIQFVVFIPGEVKQEGGGVFREGTPYQRRGSLQLWQFLVALLDDPGNAHFIAWTGRGMEFKLIEPEEVRLNTSYLFIKRCFLFLSFLNI